MRAARLTVAVLAVALLGAAPLPAHAQQVFNDFRRNGTINPCNYTDRQLREGLQGLPPDIQQYAPGLADQLAAGREGCGGGGSGGQPAATVPAPVAPGAPPPPAAPKPKIKIPPPPAPKAQARTRLADIETPTVSPTAARTGSKIPGWLLPLLVCVSLAALLVAAVRIGGWSPERFTRPVEASLAEAGGHTADALAQLRDSVRFGR